MNPKQLWIMLDVETTGPDYARHSLTEIGVAAGSVAGLLVNFAANKWYVFRRTRG